MGRSGGGGGQAQHGHCVWTLKSLKKKGNKGRAIGASSRKKHGAGPTQQQLQEPPQKEVF
jgi:hypothetical protein